MIFMAGQKFLIYYQHISLLDNSSLTLIISPDIILVMCQTDEKQKLSLDR
jgi:hypothetical protein